jgi:hypothetical protein
MNRATILISQRPEKKSLAFIVAIDRNLPQTAHIMHRKDIETWHLYSKQPY